MLHTSEVDLRHLDLRYAEVPGGGYLGIVNERETERMGTSKNKSLAESLHYFMYSMERVCPASDTIDMHISACLGRSIDGTAWYSFFRRMKRVPSSPPDSAKTESY
jgi:hypothetical protein